MSVNENLLEILMKFNENGSPVYKFYLQDGTYLMTDVSIINSPIPVNEPTTRGGVYFSDKFAFKMTSPYMSMFFFLCINLSIFICRILSLTYKELLNVKSGDEACIYPELFFLYLIDLKSSDLLWSK